MNSMQKGLVLGGLQLLLVVSLGGKLLVDRTRLPRVWARTVGYDPNLPIRGRYLSVQVLVDASRIYGSTPQVDPKNPSFWQQWREARLEVANGKLVALPDDGRGGLSVSLLTTANGATAVLNEPVAFFLPEHAWDPTGRKPGEELWVEVTVPKKGPPRPIRLAIKRGDNFTPLEYK